MSFNPLFIEETDGFANEIITFTTQVDYKKIFKEELSEETKTDLYEEALHCYKLLSSTNFEDTTFISIQLTSELRKVSDMNVEIELFMTKFTTQPHQIGFQVYIKNTGTSDPVQSFSLRTDTTTEYTFVNGLYNILFYIYIFMKDFRFNPLFNNFYHKDDLVSMTAIRSRRIRLFGDEDMICCTCLEKTIITTTCGHYLCLFCLTKLKNKVCPMCRNVLIAPTPEFVQLDLRQGTNNTSLSDRINEFIVNIAPRTENVEPEDRVE